MFFISFSLLSTSVSISVFLLFFHFLFFVVLRIVYLIRIIVVEKQGNLELNLFFAPKFGELNSITPDWLSIGRKKVVVLKLSEGDFLPNSLCVQY